MFKSSLWLLYNYYCFADLLGIIRWSLFSLLNAESLHKRLVHLGGLNVEGSLSRSLSTSSGISEIAGKKHRLLFCTPFPRVLYLIPFFLHVCFATEKCANLAKLTAWQDSTYSSNIRTNSGYCQLSRTCGSPLGLRGSRRVSAPCTRARLELEDGERRRRGCGKHFISVFICARVSVWACVRSQGLPLCLRTAFPISICLMLLYLRRTYSVRTQFLLA